MARASPRMLLVAADPTLRFTLEEVLAYYGYAVTTAASVPAAKTLLEAYPFDMLLMAHALPNPSDAERPQAAEPAAGDGAIWLDWIPV